MQSLTASSMQTHAQIQARDLKHELKDWEANFHKKHGRAATKNDLIQMPDIARKYREYSKLKKETAGRRMSEQQAEKESAHIVLPMDTSTLAMPLKRKPSAIKEGEQVTPSPVHLSLPPFRSKQQALADMLSSPQADCDTCRGEVASGESDHDCDRREAIESKPKRRRRVVPLDQTIGGTNNAEYCECAPAALATTTKRFADDGSGSDQTTEASRSHGESLAEANDAGVRMLVDANSDAVTATDWDTVIYHPLPSLIRQYRQQRPAQVQMQIPIQTQKQAQSLASGAAVGNSCMAHQPLVRSLNMMSMSEQEPTLSARVSVPMFKARAGRLVKTTSISLSAFGGQIHGDSQMGSAQGHTSDGHEECDARTRPTGGMGDLTAGELVAGDSDSEDEAAAGQSNASSSYRKKTTQKRSTRRVKLKPVGKDGNIEGTGRSRTVGLQNLVSNNFYKLRLKNGRRGPQSTEDRRTALYKRMITKKGHVKTTVPGSKVGSQDAENGTEGWAEDGMYMGSDSDNFDDSCNVNNRECQSDTEVGSRRSAQPTRLIHGQSLFSFRADTDSMSSELCALDSVGHCIDMRKVLRHVWGFDAFRSEQATAMQRIIEGRSSLLILATGAGKSLAYQLPAAVLWAATGGLTLVVTPLVALMRDQIRGLPQALRALCLSGEDASSFSDAAKKLAGGDVQLLFVSPERLQSPRFHALMARAGVPRVHLAVIDEAHCACEWSHNFRPAYLQLPEALSRLGDPCVLAMTATATAALAARLASMFAIDNHDIVRGGVLRPNILLGAVAVDVGAAKLRSTAREETLLAMLRSPEMVSLGAVLVYVATQATADRVAEFLTARSVPAQAYHAGKQTAERTRIQTAFMRETSGVAAIRVLVATVAFGMGLDKSDIRAVVHFNLPRSMEAYVQEVGRAGRDGAQARGILLLAMQDGTMSSDAVVIRSWAHSDGVDSAAVRRLLLRLFPGAFVRNAIAAAALARRSAAALGSKVWRVAHTAVLELAALQADIDADQAVVQTLLNYLALADPATYSPEPNTHRKCAIRFMRTDLAKLAESHSFFSKLADHLNAGASALPRQGIRLPAGKRPPTSATVDVFDLARAMSMTPEDVSSELHYWRAKRELFLEWQEPSCVIKVTLDMSKFAADLAAASDNEDGPSDEVWSDQLALRVDSYISTLAASITANNDTKIRDSLRRVDCVASTMFAASRLPSDALTRNATDNMSMETDASLAPCVTQNEFIQAAIDTYFAASPEASQQHLASLRPRLMLSGSLHADRQDSGLFACLCSLAQQSAPPDAITQATAGNATTEACVNPETRARIRSFVYQHCAQLKTARAIARIFHGLSSPACSSSQWMWCPEWASMVSTDFETVRQCAQEELVRLHCSPQDSTLPETSEPPADGY